MSKTAIFDQFTHRHIGPDAEETAGMLSAIGVPSLDTLIDETVPSGIRLEKEPDLPEALTESEYLRAIRTLAGQNKVFTNYIGLGYHGTHTPSVIRRNIFENPGWYTQYTPYQGEIAQGRLEALLNFQTMVADLTAMPIANASLLDEGTAAAEAMAMFHGIKNKRKRDDGANIFLVADTVFPHTIDVLRSRAEPLGIEIRILPWREMKVSEDIFGVLLQYPDGKGQVEDYRSFCETCKTQEVYVSVAADILSLALLRPPGEWGADAVVGNTQRFGVPLGFGGPHAAFFATRDDFKRQIPGRIIGVSVDSQGNAAFRMALQTREQHIRREKATSNICTAQALLAIMAGMYAVYHGPEGIRAIAERVHALTGILAANLAKQGYQQRNTHYFDTLNIQVNGQELAAIRERALDRGVNLHYLEDGVQLSLDETTTLDDVQILARIFAEAVGSSHAFDETELETVQVPESLVRQSTYLEHPIFNSFHTETKMMRYIKRLENRDISLTHSMIPLGSCTMKLNAATELMPLGWNAFSDLHPFAPLDQAQGYLSIFRELEQWLSAITGFAACSLQPNSGAQGEFAGLMCIRAYHQNRNEDHRKVALIPQSAHGTNPASAVMAGMDVVVVKCDERGDIDIDDLKAKAEKHAERLSSLMITYPSTHGVYESRIREVCQIVHEHGGLVYMDGANMNAQMGLTSPGAIHADVCHLNLHKTFAIPHGGGGPGVGPICVNEKLKPFLPRHRYAEVGGEEGIPAVASAPWGSASILLISYGYIRMLGKQGLRACSEYAILNANYIKARLQADYPILYTGENGHSAHELIVDLRPFKAVASAEDVAKRLIDYGFHAPTLSWPVAGTIMIEPTESESKDELDRFCDAMLQIKREMDAIAAGEADPENNVLRNAPHTAEMCMADEWPFPYSRQLAAYPLPYLRKGFKFWPVVSRINNAYGDRNLMCTCPPMEVYEEGMEA